MAALADYLLFGHSRGANITALALAFAVLLVVRYRGRLRRSLPLAALWLLVAAGATLQSSIIGVMLLISLGWAALAMSARKERPALATSMAAGLFAGLRAFFEPVSDFIKQRMLAREGGKAWGTPAWVVIGPAAIVLIFAALIIPANLAVAEWVKSFANWVGEVFENLTFARVFLWAMVGLQAYGLMRFRVSRRAIAASAAEPDAQPRRGGVNELHAAILTFVGLNALFVVANAADAAYLWFSFKLPAGLTYSEFAHRGAYRLIVAVVLSALVIAGFFRRSAPQSWHAAARALGYLFIAQNVVVLLGAARRLELYVDVYGLTRFRVAAFLWILLVLAGFALILVKLARNRSFVWLLRVNTVTAAALLAAVSLLDLNGFIAEWNLARHERGTLVKTDVDYLRSLGPSALPALARLSGDSNTEIAGEAEAAYRQVLADAKTRLEHWQSWTYRVRQAMVKSQVRYVPGNGRTLPSRQSRAEKPLSEANPER